MLKIGIVVDSKTRKEYTEILDSGDTEVTVEHTIIGVSYLDLKTSSVLIDTNYICKDLDDYFYLKIGGIFRETRLIARDTLVSSVDYSIENIRCGLVLIENVLPVYMEDGSLLVSCNSDKFQLSCSHSLYAIVDIETCNISVDCRDELYLFDVSEIYGSDRIETSEFLTMFEKSMDGIYTHGDICYVDTNSLDKFIVPIEINKLVINYFTKIDTLVLHSAVNYIYTGNKIFYAKIHTIYISKDSTIKLIGMLLHDLIGKFEENNHVDTSVEDFMDKIDVLYAKSDFESIWKLCNKKENKPIMDCVLSDTNIVVY